MGEQSDDGHAAIAITATQVLAARRAELPRTAVFVFQPARSCFSALNVLRSRVGS